MFVSYYKLVRRIWAWKIAANAGPHQLPREPDEEGDVSVSSDMDDEIEEVPLQRDVSLTTSTPHKSC